MVSLFHVLAVAFPEELNQLPRMLNASDFTIGSSKSKTCVHEPIRPYGWAGHFIVFSAYHITNDMTEFNEAWNDPLN